MSVDLVVFCFSAVDGFHVKRVTQNEGYVVFGAQICEPVPRKDALHRNRDVFSVRGNRLKESLWTAGHVSVRENLALGVQDTDVHRSGVQIDSAVVSVLLSIEFHIEVSSFIVFGNTSIPKSTLRRGASMSITCVEKDAVRASHPKR